VGVSTMFPCPSLRRGLGGGFSLDCRGSQSLAATAKPTPTLIRKVLFLFLAVAFVWLTVAFQGFHRDNNLLLTCIHLKQLASLYRAYPEQRFCLPGATITHTRSNDRPTRSNALGAVFHSHHAKRGKTFASMRLPTIPTRSNGGILHCALFEEMRTKGSRLKSYS